MAESKKHHTKPGILASSRRGSPTWGCRYPVGSVLSDKPSPGTPEHVAKDEKFRRNTGSPSAPAWNVTRSVPLTDPNEGVSQEYPVDIFQNNLIRSEVRSDSKCQPVDIFRHNSDIRHPNGSIKIDDSHLPVRSRTKKTRTPNLTPRPTRDIPKAERKSTIEKEDPSALQERRRLSCKDHPLKALGLKRITGDAEDLDLENKIRSALSHRTRRPSPEKPIAKSVTWDPAIVSCGPQSTLSPFVESKPTIQKDQSIELKDCLQTILSLKKNDRHKLRGLLNALSRIDGDSPVNPAETTIENKGKGPLNPKAPEFRTTSSFQHHIRSENLAEQHACSTLHTLHTLHTMPQPIWIRTPPVVQTKPTDEIHDDGHGRETRSIDPIWAKSLLEKFSARYPLTGKLKAAPPSAAKGRLASAIQQRLEYLLLQEKEKKALAGKENESLKLNECLGYVL